MKPDLAAQAEGDSNGPDSRVAVLGTLAEFHSEPIPYNLEALLELVSAVQPDLLCLDMTPEQWRNREFGGLPPEYREVLLPLAHQTDMVVAPIAGEDPPHEPEASGWRRWMIAVLRRWLAVLQRTAPSADAINRGWRHDLANHIYEGILWLGGPECRLAWKKHRHHLIRAVLAVVRRDPGRRVLVVVNVRHCHHIRPALSNQAGIQVVHHNYL